MFRRGDDERHESMTIQPGEVRPKEPAAGARSGGGEVTVVGKGARIEGNLLSTGSLRVDGQVKGKIAAEGDVTLSSRSQVQGDIQATNVVVAGQFKGNIIVANRAEVARGGRVDGNITSKVLVVAEGASFSGQSIMDGGTAAAQTARRDVAGTAAAVSRDGPATRQGAAAGA